MCKLQRLVFYPKQPFEIHSQTQTFLSTQSTGHKRALNMCSLDPGSCSLVTPADNMDTGIQSVWHMYSMLYTHRRIHTSTQSFLSTLLHNCVEVPCLACVHTFTILPPPRHNHHPSLPRISCSLHIMLKWTCIIALARFLVFVGDHQQPPWCLQRRWSLLQEPQIKTQHTQIRHFREVLLSSLNTLVFSNYKMNALLQILLKWRLK